MKTEGHVTAKTPHPEFLHRNFLRSACISSSTSIHLQVQINYEAIANLCTQKTGKGKRSHFQPKADHQKWNWVFPPSVLAMKGLAKSTVSPKLYLVTDFYFSSSDTPSSYQSLLGYVQQTAWQHSPPEAPEIQLLCIKLSVYRQPLQAESSLSLQGTPLSTKQPPKGSGIQSLLNQVVFDVKSERLYFSIISQAIHFTSSEWESWSRSQYSL